jgi:hypothetical protein
LLAFIIRILGQNLVLFLTHIGSLLLLNIYIVIRNIAVVRETALLVTLLNPACVSRPLPLYAILKWAEFLKSSFFYR